MELVDLVLLVLYQVVHRSRCHKTWGNGYSGTIGFIDFGGNMSNFGGSITTHSSKIGFFGVKGLLLDLKVIRNIQLWFLRFHRTMYLCATCLLGCINLWTACGICSSLLVLHLNGHIGATSLGWAGLVTLLTGEGTFLAGQRMSTVAFNMSISFKALIKNTN